MKSAPATPDERTYREIVENLDDIFYRTDLDGRIRIVNRAVEHYGYRPEELIGKSTLPLYSDPVMRERRVATLLANGVLHDEELILRTKDGAFVPVSVSAHLLFDAQGRPAAIEGTLRDISKRKQLAERLHFVEYTVEQSNDALFWTDADGRFVRVNEAACRMLGYAREELLRLSVSDIHPQFTAADWEAHWNHITKHGSYTVESHQRTKQGRVFPVELTITHMKFGGREYNCAFVRDISERKRAEEELREAKVAAEAADRVKSAFLATMSHELRTPLNSIIGFTGMLLQCLAGPLNEEQTKQLGMVRVSARHLLDLISDILDLSKIEAGRLEIAWEPCDVRAAIDRALATAAPLAREKDLALRADVASEVGSVTADRRRLEQILLNLIGNAVKFTERGSVTVRAEIRDDVAASQHANPEAEDLDSQSRSAPRRLRIAVVDTGIGIDPRDRDKLFAPFRQIDRGGTGIREGTGLGLAICKKLVTLMGGDIEVESEPGAGSTFALTLPVKDPPVTARFSRAGTHPGRRSDRD